MASATPPARAELFVHYAAVGSGEGINLFRNGAVDFGASDFPLSAAQTAQIERGVVQAPVTAGMIVLAYNLPGVSAQLKLPQDVYVDIFLGRIKTWRDPRIRAANPGVSLPSINIFVIGRLDSSGTTLAFTSHLAAIAKRWTAEGPGVGRVIDWPHGAMLVRGNEGVASRIKVSEGAIGYVEFGFARRLRLPVALLQNKDGQFVAPTPGNGIAALAASAGPELDDLLVSVANPPGALAYPIVTYSWLLLYENYPADKAEAIRSFVGWGLGDGQAVAAELGYLPLPSAVADLAKSSLARIK
jgi:phosphate transport system substrate-binding protein